MEKPIVYIRCEHASPYIDSLYPLAKEIIVEPWEAGGLMPPMEVDISKVNIIVTRGLVDEMPWLDQAVSLQWVHSVTVGVEKLPVQKLAERNIAITNVKGLNAIPISEYVIAGVMAFAKGYFMFLSQQQRRIWQTQKVKEVSGSTIAILGFGHIGQAVAKRAKALGMQVHVMGRSKLENIEQYPIDHYYENEQFETAVSNADYVINCLPESEQTYHFMNGKRFKLMKTGVLFINVGRGSTVDDTALLAAVNSQHVAGAILDVFHQEPIPKDHGYWDTPNIYITPHNAFASPKHWNRIFEQLAQNLNNHLKQLPLSNTVDPNKGY